MLSTQRSDSIVCLGSDGSVAQVGTYAELSADKNGEFAKLMEWQMSGGAASARRPDMGEEDAELTEEERMKRRLEEHDRDRENHDLEPTEEETKWESVSVKDGRQSAAETVVEKTGEFVVKS